VTGATGTAYYLSVPAGHMFDLSYFKGTDLTALGATLTGSAGIITFLTGEASEGEMTLTAGLTGSSTTSSTTTF
jgi:hypothetical protein